MLMPLPRIVFAGVSSSYGSPKSLDSFWSKIKQNTTIRPAEKATKATCLPLSRLDFHVVVSLPLYACMRLLPAEGMVML
jgi:hypothetical protein